MSDDLQTLRDQLSIYRLALGQPDQEALIHAIHRRVVDAHEDQAEVLRWLEKARVNLQPQTASQIALDSSLTGGASDVVRN